MTAATADAPEECPIHLDHIPPPRPFNAETARRWLEEEAPELYRELEDAVLRVTDYEERNALWNLLSEANIIREAAESLALGHEPERPLVVGGFPEAPDATTRLRIVLSTANNDLGTGEHASYERLRRLLDDRLDLAWRHERGDLSREEYDRRLCELAYPMDPEAADDDG